MAFKIDTKINVNRRQRRRQTPFEELNKILVAGFEDFDDYDWMPRILNLRQ